MTNYISFHVKISKRLILIIQKRGTNQVFVFNKSPIDDISFHLSKQITSIYGKIENKYELLN